MRVLLIERNEAQAQAIELILTRAGAVVEVTDTAEDGIDLVKNYDFDIVLLDMGMPDMRGIDVLRHLRRNKVTVPVLSLSNRDGITEKVAALNAGADDYLVRPFHGDELAARIVSLVRRSRNLASSDVELGNLVLNLDDKTVKVDGVQVRLTGKEHQVLELLAMRRGTAVTKEMMLNHLYGGLDEPEAKIIDVFVCKLRKKLRAAGMARVSIETVWGRGYLMHETAAAAVAVPQARAAA